MCNYLLLRPICPTCLRIRADGPPTDPLIADPTPISICDAALKAQRICHSDSPNNAATPSHLNVIGSEQCSMCEQAQAEQYLPPADSRIMYKSELIEELDELETSEWPTAVRTRQVQGYQGHLLRVIWERQVKKRDLLEQGMKVPILDSDFAGTTPSAVSFSTGSERKKEQSAYFRRIHGIYAGSVYSDNIPGYVPLADIKRADALLQIDTWERAGHLSTDVAQLTRTLHKNLAGRMGQHRNTSARYFLAVCAGLAEGKLGGPEKTLEQLAQMAGNVDRWQEVKSIRIAVLDVYVKLKNVDFAPESGVPSALNGDSTEVDIEQGRQVRFRSPEEGDVLVFSSGGSSASSSPTTPSHLEAFIKGTANSEESGESRGSSDRKDGGKHKKNSSADSFGDLAGNETQDTPEVSSALSNSVSSGPYYRLLTISDEEWKVLQLAEIPAALLVQKRRWTTTERAWRDILNHRFQILKGYTRKSRPEFPGEKSYRLDAVVTALALMDTRKAYRTSLSKEKIPVLHPNVFDRASGRADEMLDGHIRFAVEQLKKLRTKEKKRTEPYILQYVAHVITISCDIGDRALKKLVEDDPKTEIVPSKQEWADMRAYQKRGYRINQREGPPASESSGLTQSDFDDSNRPKLSYTQLVDKAVNFYHLWTAEWIDMAKQLQQHEPVRRILKLSSPPASPPASPKNRKRSHYELDKSNTESKSPEVKRVRRSARIVENKGSK